MRRCLQSAMVVLLLAGMCAAGDLARLRNGFGIRHERREVLGDVVRLHVSDSGYIDVPSIEIVGYEQDDTPTPPPVAPQASAPKTLDQHVAEASTSSGIDSDFLNSVIRYESGFNPKAVSRKGARGLMQLMPQTADHYGVKDAFDPGQNIQGGTAYLRELLLKYDGDAQRALAAYNAGPHRVEQYKGVPPYSETRAYVAAIIRDYNRKKSLKEKSQAAPRSRAKAKSTGVTAAKGGPKPQG